MDITSQPDLIEEHSIHEGEYVYAGFWLRFWAYLIDLIVIASVNRIIIYPFIQGFDISNRTAVFSLEALLTGLVFFAYFAIMTKVTNQTLGKMVVGVKVVSIHGDNLSWGTIIFREVIGRFISKALFGLVYIWVAFSPRKQGVHDYFADTWVIHTEK